MRSGEYMIHPDTMASKRLYFIMDRVVNDKALPAKVSEGVELFKASDTIVFYYGGEEIFHMW